MPAFIGEYHGHLGGPLRVQQDLRDPHLRCQFVSPETERGT